MQFQLELEFSISIQRKFLDAPEVRFLGGSLTQASDIYSFGYILEELAILELTDEELKRAPTSVVKYRDGTPIRFIQV